MSKTAKRSVLAILMIIIITLATKLLGFVRDIYIGQIFAGAPRATDIYFSSLGLATISFLSIGSAIVITTIPLIINLRNNENKDKVLSGVFTYLLLFSVLGGAIYFFFSEQIVNIFFGDYSIEEKILASNNLKILSITLIYICITYFNIAILQANEEYKIPALISIPYNLLIIGFLFFIGNKKGLQPLVIATMLGWLLQMLLTVPKTLKFAEFKFRPNLKNTDGLVFPALLGIIPVMLIYLTAQGNINIAYSFLAGFDGGATIYYYGQTMFQAIATIIVYAIGAVMFPKFSIALNEDRQSFFSSVSQVGQSVIVLMLPITICLLLFSQPIVEIFFLRGDFTVDNAQATANTLKILSLYMIAYGFLDILNRGYFTLGDKKTPIFGTITILATSFIFNYIFIEIMNLSEYFVAVSTVIAYFTGVSISSILFSKKYGNLGVRNILKSFAKALIAGICMIIVQLILHNLFGKNLSEINVIYKLIVLAIEGITVVLVYVGVLVLLKEKNLYEFIIRLKNKNNNK